VAGPFHPAFGHMVYSEVFFDLLVREFERHETLPKNVTLLVFPGDVPKVIGQYKTNIKRLIKRFRLDTIRVMADVSIQKDTAKMVQGP
jgi:hypothetical protein